MSTQLQALLCAILAVSLVSVEGFVNVYPQPKSRPRRHAENAAEPLFLTPLIESGRIDEARGKATVEHKEMDDVGSYAGFLTVNKEYNSNLFFWFFPAMQNPKTAPVMLWLQGGPGASSMFGVFVENGPLVVTANNTLQRRKYCWTMSHNIIYLDSPVGTGFSFTDNKEGFATNETDIGRDVYAAVIQFFKLFPELQANDFYVVGESYAGKYVPAVSYTIKNNNVNAETKINLKGLAIGNGLTDPINQLFYGDYLYQLGLLDFNGRDVFYKYEKQGNELIQQKKYEEAFDVFDELIGGDLLGRPSVFKNLTGFDFYFNILLTRESNDSILFVDWVQQPDVRRAIHVGNYSFDVINKTVEEYMRGDVLQSVADFLADLVQHYKVLIYNGQLDIIVTYPTVENYLLNLKWPGAERYKQAPRKQWWVENELAGYTKTVDNLTEILVRNSGHMVPVDQPQWALDFITRFTHNKPF